MARFRADTRGVKWTLQAYLFMLILLGGVVVAAGSLPNDRAPSEFTDIQRQQMVEDLLSTTAGTGALGDGVRYWNASAGRWVGAAGGANDTTYTTLSGEQSHPLWPALNRSLRQRGIAANVDVRYQVDTDGDGVSEGTRTQPLLRQGPPGRAAVTVSTSVYLTDDAVPAAGPTSEDGDPCTLGELTGSRTSGTNGCLGGAFFAPDAAPGSARYNVVQVRVTVWSV